MKINEQLSNKDKQKLLSSVKGNKQENLSRREWEEIMGTNKDTYKRVRGSVRRK